jgi:hypothetical protein
MSDTTPDGGRIEEQEQLAREIGEEITDAFVAYVRGDVAFEDLTFGVFDALSDLHVIAGGDYVLEDPDAEVDDEDDNEDNDEDHGHDHEEGPDHEH